MTEKLFVGSLEDCNIIRQAVDIVLDMPQAPTSGPLAVNAVEREQRRLAWFAMTTEQKEAIIANPQGTPYAGWSLQFSGTYPEYEPGTRLGVFLPSTIAAMTLEAAQQGRTLTLEQATALATAQTVWMDSFPANWVNPPP